VSYTRGRKHSQLGCHYIRLNEEILRKDPTLPLGRVLGKGLPMKLLVEGCKRTNPIIISTALQSRSSCCPLLPEGIKIKRGKV